MRKLKTDILNSKYSWIVLLILLAVINWLASDFHLKLDLTKEKRYTLSKPTKELLKNLENNVQIDVFLKGDFPSGFRKLANSTNDFLRLLKDRTGKIFYRFLSPLENVPGSNTTYGDSLVSMGAVPINLTVQKKEGESSNIIFPVALVKYKGKQALVNLYPGASSRITQDEINSAEALMEYQFVKTLDKLTREKKPRIAYSIGNGQPVESQTWDLVQTLKQDYDFGRLNLKTQPGIPRDIDILLIVKPTEEFSEAEKLKLDQFVMGGGKLLCFIDNLIAEQDSLAFKPETIAYDRNLNLTDLFFRYGLRINTDLVMDLQCDFIPLVVGGTTDNPQFEFLKWNYFPLFATGKNKIINKSLGYIGSRFVNSMDTIQVSGIKKNVILSSSANSRVISTPALISLNENKNAPEDEKFRQNAIPVGILLEGSFTSFFKNRLSQSQKDTLAAAGIPFQPVSPENKMIVVADGDMVLNDLTPEGPLPMGWNKYTYREYQNQTEAGKLFFPVANREFLLSCVEYLVNSASIIETRNKDIILRLLNSKKINQQKTRWQIINIALPILLIILSGFAYQQVRKRKYAA
jgi:gliding-associated putative ABC transporter substrate-binding component GldG